MKTQKIIDAIVSKNMALNAKIPHHRDKYEYGLVAHTMVQTDCLRMLNSKIAERYPSDISSGEIRQLTEEVNLIMNHLTKDTVAYNVITRHGIIVFKEIIDNILYEMENKHE